MSTKGTRSTIGFGCPNEIDAHHFVVKIEAKRSSPVLIVEHYGIQGETVERCALPRQTWTAFAEEVQFEFNQRLKENHLSIGRWKIGENKVERLLGKELLVLAWGVEQADLAAIPQAVKNWKGFKPEERWWLCTMTAGATGKVTNAGIGWRKALYHILVENPVT
jgi:hypothetical protein